VFEAAESGRPVFGLRFARYSPAAQQPSARTVGRHFTIAENQTDANDHGTALPSPTDR
jgi:hypothetical protein